jgi:hypothetical protein
VHIQRIRQVTGRRWEADAKRWIIPYSEVSLQEFTKHFDALDVEISAELWVESDILRNWKLSGEQTQWKRDDLQQALKLRGYSRKTIKAYCNQIERFCGQSSSDQYRDQRVSCPDILFESARAWNLSFQC